MKDKIYTVGDKVRYIPTGFNIEISSFYIKNDELFFTSKHLQEDKEYSFKEIGDVVKPLFKTFDGVDIYEGDKVYLVHTAKDLLDESEFEIWDIGETEIYAHVYNALKGMQRYFSTKEAAEEYILMNKPCLSINDVLDLLKNKGGKATFTMWETEFKLLGKSKLKL